VDGADFFCIDGTSGRMRGIGVWIKD
jgi:hypothetical protein